MAKGKMDIKKKIAITHEFRLAFPSLAKPKGYKEQAPKYGCTALFPKDTNLGIAPANKKGEKLSVSLKRAIKNAAIEKWGEDETEWPEGMKMPLKDGDKKKQYQGFEGCISAGMTNKDQPGMVDQRLRPITGDKINQEFYAGCWCKAEVIAYAYDTNGNRGVGLSIQNIQKVRDDDAFGGRKAAQDVFDRIDDAGGDEEDYEDESDDSDDDDDSEEEDEPAPKKKKAAPPVKKKKQSVSHDDDDEDGEDAGF